MERLKDKAGKLRGGFAPPAPPVNMELRPRGHMTQGMKPIIFFAGTACHYWGDPVCLRVQT